MLGRRAKVTRRQIEEMKVVLLSRKRVYRTHDDKVENRKKEVVSTNEEFIYNQFEDARKTIGAERA